MCIYPFYLKILDFRSRFLGLCNLKKLAIGLAITRFFKLHKSKNQLSKKPLSSGRIGIYTLGTTILLSLMILKHIPNALTLFLLGLIAPFLLSIYAHQYVTAFYIFIWAGLSDGLDG